MTKEDLEERDGATVAIVKKQGEVMSVRRVITLFSGRLGEPYEVIIRPYILKSCCFWYSQKVMYFKDR